MESDQLELGPRNKTLYFLKKKLRKPKLSVQDKFMTQSSPKELIIGGIYEHYKGKRYKIHGLVRHSETLEELVLYETLYENNLGKMWVRPKEMFLETVTIDGQTKPRFKFIQNS